MTLLIEARQVLADARAAVTRARCAQSMVRRGSADEHVRWISASRNQPSESSFKAMAGEMG